MKIIKKLFWAIVILLGLVLAIVLTLPLWVGLVVPPVANSVVPSKTGTAFCLGSFGLNPYTGRLEVGDVELSNPEGFDPKAAVSASRLYVDLDPLSLMSETIVLEEIHIKDLFVSYVSDNAGKNNFDIIVSNASGNSTQTVKPEKDADKDKAKSSDDKPSKKVIIDKLRIEGVKVQWGAVVIPVPTFEMTGIGRNTMGVTFDEAWREIDEKFLKDLTALGGQVGEQAAALATQALKEIKLEGQAAEAATQALKATEAATTKSLNATTKALDATGAATTKSLDVTTKATEKTLEATTKATEKALDKTGGMIKDAGKALNGLFGK